MCDKCGEPKEFYVRCLHPVKKYCLDCVKILKKEAYQAKGK